MRRSIINAETGGLTKRNRTTTTRDTSTTTRKHFRRTLSHRRGRDLRMTSERIIIRSRRKINLETNRNGGYDTPRRGEIPYDVESASTSAASDGHRGSVYRYAVCSSSDANRRQR